MTESHSDGDAVEELTGLPDDLRALVAEFRDGRGSALARAVSVVEDRRPGFQALLHAVTAGHASSAARLGITGPPGAGKSTLISAMAERLRQRGEDVGILAVDPTSSHTGGAFLGDRIRMHDLAGDPGIFIRSMASRGSSGGLGTSSLEVLDLMEAFGFAWLLVETVGAGQLEADVAHAADTTVVVLVPESGDAVQAMKAGIMDIASVFVVNKADRPGAERLVADVESMLLLRGSTASGIAGDGWTPPVLVTEARTGEGVARLLETVEAHRAHLLASGGLKGLRRERAAGRLRGVLQRELARRAQALLLADEREASALDRIAKGLATPYSVVREILRDMGAV